MERARRRLSIWGLLVVAIVGVIAGVLLTSGGEKNAGVRVSGTVELGEPAPEVRLESFEGDTITLASFEGQPVVLNFWASWCPQCVAEMPDFERVHQALKDEVAFLGINHIDVQSAAEELAAKTGVTYPLVADPDGEVFTAFRAAGMPTTAFIGADGTVVDVVTGQLTEKQLRDKVSEYFSL